MKTKFSMLGILIFVLTMSTQLLGQTITGSWQGTLNIQGTELPLVFNITEESGEFKSTLDSPAQGATGIPTDETIYSDKSLSITIKQLGIKYMATLEVWHNLDSQIIVLQD